MYWIEGNAIPFFDKPGNKGGGSKGKTKADSPSDDPDADDSDPEPEPEPDPVDIDYGKTLMQELNRLAQLNRPAPPTPDPTPKPNPEPTPAPSPKLDNEGKVKVPEGEAFKQMLSDPSAFQKFADSLVNAGVQQGKREILNIVPQQIRKAVEEVRTMDEAASEFWRKNPELRDADSWIASRASQLAAQNPDKPLIEAYNQAGKEVRESLKKMGVELEIDETTRKPRTRKKTTSSDKIDRNDPQALAKRRMKA